MRLIVASLLMCALPAPGSAHHSAAEFDFTNDVTLQGRVTFVDVRNPHTVLILDLPYPEGGSREVEFEGHSRNNYYRNGWRPGMIEEGDTVSILIAPLRDGSDGGYVREFILADGTRF